MFREQDIEISEIESSELLKDISLKGDFQHSSVQELINEGIISLRDVEYLRKMKLKPKFHEEYRIYKIEQNLDKEELDDYCEDYPTTERVSVFSSNRKLASSLNCVDKFLKKYGEDWKKINNLK